jgi:hypothetical protein
MQKARRIELNVNLIKFAFRSFTLHNTSSCLRNVFQGIFEIQQYLRKGRHPWLHRTVSRRSMDGLRSADHCVKIWKCTDGIVLTLSNPIFLPPAYSSALIYFRRESGWWVTCNYPTVLKEKNINRNINSTTCAICWLKFVLHEEKRREQEKHNVG